MTMAKSTWVVIVNYRTPRLVVNCLSSLESQRSALEGGQVIIVDNCSGDESLSILSEFIATEGWSSWAHLLPMPNNGGFSYGNNAGVREVLLRTHGVQPHVLLLNPDTVVQPGGIRALTDFLEKNPTAGIVGAPIYRSDGTRQCSVHPWPTPMSEFMVQAKLGILIRRFPHYDISPRPIVSPQQSDWLSGACFLIRSEVWVQAGPMDEGYFLYFEEVDYCKRVSLLGWTIWLVPGPGVVHLEGAATGVSKIHSSRPLYWYASRRRYLSKHLGMLGWWFANIASLMGRASFVARRALGCAPSAVGDADPHPFRYHRIMLRSDWQHVWGRWRKG